MKLAHHSDCILAKLPTGRGDSIVMSIVDFDLYSLNPIINIL